MKKRKSIRFLIQFFFTLLLLVGAELLFACFGVQPEDGKSTLYQFYLSLLFALDLPILGCLAGYRRWIGALAAYGVTLCLKVSSFRIFTSPLTAWCCGLKIGRQRSGSFWVSRPC